MRISISSIIAWAIVVILISINIASILSGQSYIAVVSGTSMEPILSTGDIVLILPVNSPSDIKLGDVVVYKDLRGVYIIHRVINIVAIGERMYFITKGDNNRFPDMIPGYPGVPFENIVGRVVSIDGYIVKIPYVGILSLLRG
jgi:signal peptidase